MDTEYIADDIDIPAVRVSDGKELNENNKIPHNGFKAKNTKKKTPGNYFNYRNLIFFNIFIVIIIGALTGYKILKGKKAGNINNIKRINFRNVGAKTEVKQMQFKKTFKNDKLNDLFTVKYKPVQANPSLKTGIPPATYGSYMPLQLPNFNIKNIERKIKGLKPETAPDNFTVSAYSNGFVAVKCGKAVYYLKAGEESCGRILLRTDSNSAVFSHNKKSKKIAY